MLACCACEGGKSVASASSQGGLHIWRVDYTPRTSTAAEVYSGITGAQHLLSRAGSGLGADQVVNCKVAGFGVVRSAWQGFALSIRCWRSLYVAVIDDPLHATTAVQSTMWTCPGSLHG